MIPCGESNDHIDHNAGQDTNEQSGLSTESIRNETKEWRTQTVEKEVTDANSWFQIVSGNDWVWSGKKICVDWITKV